jgi:hypothetical protein
MDLLPDPSLRSLLRFFPFSLIQLCSASISLTPSTLPDHLANPCTSIAGRRARTDKDAHIRGNRVCGVDPKGSSLILQAQRMPKSRGLQFFLVPTGNRCFSRTKSQVLWGNFLRRAPEAAKFRTSSSYAEWQRIGEKFFPFPLQLWSSSSQEAGNHVRKCPFVGESCHGT